MLTFSKQEFTQRLHGAAEKLLDLSLRPPFSHDKWERLSDKRHAVEDCLAFWFVHTLDMDDEESYNALDDLVQHIKESKDPTHRPGFSEGYNLVLSYIDEYEY